jgi:hypothetical protein
MKKKTIVNSESIIFCEMIHNAILYCEFLVF